MEVNLKLQKIVIDTVSKQIKGNNPPEVKLAYQRLKKEGYDDFTCKQFIGQCLAVELFNMMKYKKEYNEKKYVKNLNKLPEAPFKD